jgi:ATP-binding cassette subfamily C protein CydCD
MRLIDTRLLHQVKSNHLSLGLTITLGFMDGLFTVIQAWILSRMIEGVFLGGIDLQGSIPRMSLLLLLFLGRASVKWASEISAKQVALAVKTSLREKLYTHIQKLGPLYVRGERTGELINTATEGIEALDAYFSEYLPQLVLAVMVPVTFLFFIFPLDRLSGLVLLLTAPLIPIFMVLIGERADGITKRQWRTLSRMSAHFLDVLQGLTTLKLFGRSRAQISVIRQVSEQFRARTMSTLRVAFLSALVLEMVATLCTAIVAVEIGLRLLYGRLDFGQALFVLLLAPEFYLPLRLLGACFHAGVTGVTAAGRIFEILSDSGVDGAVNSNKLTGEIDDSPNHPIIFDSVSFTYPDGRMALKNITFTIEPGQKVALVGPSGAGKSTIAALLLDWMEPSTGKLQGRKDTGATAWVPQNPYLFYDSIAANIRIASPDASMKEIVIAAKNAHAHEFIEEMGRTQTQTHLRTTTIDLPGYQTLIGERGTRLSGGQAQRIALARAFLIDAPFVILDEPTANLDPELENQIAHSWNRLLMNRSALIIAHRLNTIRSADKIIVLDRGQIVQQGTYDELVRQDGLFQSMVNQSDRQRPLKTSADRPDTGNDPAFNDTHDGSLSTIDLPEWPNHIPAPTSTLLRLFSFLRPYLGWITLSIVLGFITIASGIGLMGTSAYLISAAALQPSIAALQVPIVAVRFFGISRGVFRYLERLASHNTAFRVLADMRVWFYKQLEPLAPARLEQFRSSELFTRILSDINTLENFCIRVVAPPLTAFLVAIFSGLILLSYAPQLTVTFWGFLSLAGIALPWWTFRLARDLGTKTLIARADLNNALVDGIQGLPDLLAFGRGYDQMQCIQNLGDRLAQDQAHYANLSGLGAAFMSLITNMGMWTVLILAIPMVVNGHIDGVYLAVIMLVVFASFEAVQNLPASAQHLEENLRAAENLFGMVDTEPEVKPPTEPRAIPANNVITVRDLNFSYPSPSSTNPSPTHFSLQISSLSLLPGKRLAIVGPSGSGKTTLLNLLLRFWDFQDGDISFGGGDIRIYDPDKLRSKFALVSQNTHLFNASVRENLLIAKPNAREDEIVRATKSAQIHEFIENLPDGYQTFIGEQGLLLSGGERQRLAIARALLQDAPILLLDEPTANLDPLTELAILESIHNLMQGRSTLLITHRLVGMDWMDEILVLQTGQIVERGSHNELLAKDGVYHRMWDLQNLVLGY